jgi:hypothetical protein
VTGLLVPLVLAAVLSVVAVKAARRGPVLISSPAAVATPQRPSTGVRLSGRRLAGAGIVAAAVVGLVALAGQGERHSGGDPGGRILEGLTSATAAVPAGARVLSRKDSEPAWATCDAAPGSGWTDVGASVQFSASLSRTELTDRVDRQLAGRGWRLDGPTGKGPGGPGTVWTRTLAGGIQATAVLEPTDRSGVWWLRASAPPQGARFSENC